jgi:hypothetical protein
MSKQKELFTSNWGVNSGYKRLVDELTNLLPMEGRCEKPLSDNKNLETFRRAQNAIYDFFNNGLCNKRSLFVFLLKTKIIILTSGIFLQWIVSDILQKIVGLCGKIKLKRSLRQS